MSSWIVVWPGMLVLGALVGFLGGLLGIGGGILAIPVLALLFGMDQATAQGTALVMIAPNVVLAFWRYSQHHPIALRRTLTLGAVSIVVSYPAARLAVSLDHHTLRWIFIGFLLWLVGYLGWQLYARRAKGAPAPRILSERWLPLVSVVAGAFSGLFTVGGGTISSPMLVGLFGYRQAAAQGLGLCMIVPSSLVAMGTYTHAGVVDWQLGIPLAIGGLSTISRGVALAQRLPDRKLRGIFLVFLMITVVLMLPKG